jgi:hypothetical protein
MEMAVELGQEDPKVTLDHFVRLFVNHRSVFDIERANFEQVFFCFFHFLVPATRGPQLIFSGV